MKVRLSDPFGLVELDRTFQTTSSLVVTPRVVPLPVVPLSGAWTGSGDNRPRAFASGSAEDVTVREYRRGDDLRRVHWRSSAHAGELMVRREEQPWQSRATLFLDNRKIAHRGSGAASSLEHAVSAAASIARAPGAARLQRAAGDGGGRGARRLLARARRQSAETAPLLESLAVLTETTHPHIDLRWLQDARPLRPADRASSATSPSTTSPRSPGCGTPASSAMAVALDVPAWARGSSPGSMSHGPAHRLAGRRTAGASVSAGPQDPLPAVWQELGMAKRSSSRPRRRDRPDRSAHREPVVTTLRDLRPTTWLPSLLAAPDHLGHAAGLDQVRREPGRLHGAAPRRLPPGRGRRHAAARRPPAGRRGRARSRCWSCCCGSTTGSPATSRSAAGCPPRTRCARCSAAFGDSVDASQAYAAPVPQSVPEFYPLLILAGTLTAVLVDFLAVRAAPGPARRAAAAGPLHRAGEHPRRRRLLAEVRGRRALLPVPDRRRGVAAARALGPPARAGRPDLRHPDHRGQRPGDLVLGPQDRPDRDRPRRRRAGAGADLQRHLLRRRRRRRATGTATRSRSPTR